MHSISNPPRASAPPPIHTHKAYIIHTSLHAHLMYPLKVRRLGSPPTFCECLLRCCPRGRSLLTSRRGETRRDETRRQPLLLSSRAAPPASGLGLAEATAAHLSSRGHLLAAISLPSRCHLECNLVAISRPSPMPRSRCHLRCHDLSLPRSRGNLPCHDLAAISDHDLAAICPAPRRCPSVPGTCHPVPGTCHQVPGTCHQVPGTCHPVPGTCHPVAHTAGGHSRCWPTDIGITSARHRHEHRHGIDITSAQTRHTHRHIHTGTHTGTLTGTLTGTHTPAHTPARSPARTLSA